MITAPNAPTMFASFKGVPPAIQFALCPVPADRAGQSTAVRACACDLLRSHAVNAPHIGRHESGAPLWPEGWVGSLTHSAGWGAVAVARTDAIRALGIDLEDPQRMKRALWAHVLTPSEILALAGLPEDVANEKATASFSAKEAIYKAIAPLGGRTPGFHEVELAWDRSGRFSARGTTPETFMQVDELVGSSMVHQDRIITVAWLNASAATAE